MQKISIKKKVIKTQEGSNSYYYVQALSLKNSDNEVKLLVPHPNGTDVMEFNTLAEAAATIRKAGYEYTLPDGEIVEEENINPVINNTTTQDSLKTLLINKFMSKINDMNTSVVASAITALDYLATKDAIDIFIEKLGEDNEKIRNAAIDALVHYQGFVVDKLIDTLSSPNWVSRNSAITCLVKISEYAEVAPEKIIIPIINRIDDENVIVQSSAIIAAGKIYNNYIKRTN